MDPSPPKPFSAFAAGVQRQGPLRAAITAAYRRPEEECVRALLDEATLPPDLAAAVGARARRLVEALRRKGIASGVQGLIHEFALSSQEGIALMCLAEALLRIPDAETRDALIRDKIAAGDWRTHLGHSPSLFVNAATWGLVVTGKLTATTSEAGLSSALTRLIAQGGEPLIRAGVDIAMRMMGEQFVKGQTIAEALTKSRALEAKDFRYSYDMLGEAATTAEDAARYYADYENAIHAIGKASAERGIYEGPGISIKLSALHPRYSRAKRERVMSELLPRLKALAVLARQYDIGLNIDAEEADRLEISLDLLEALCFDPALAGWNGIGFVIQAYQKRCPFVIDWIIDLARRSRHRLMIRLVKGAYWDSEIKRAQVDGLEGFPVYTRKVHTDVSYLACARKLLAAPDAVFPQFATHNAQTLSSIMAMAGANFYRGQYEFQCLHGMGEPLYEEVVGRDKLNRPCRIYAPVGTHETLLAYLVRRLLENGANSSFVNRIADPRIPIDDLIADPVTVARAITPVGAPHERIVLPRDLYGQRRQNSAGLDLSNEQQLASLATALEESAKIAWKALPTGAKTEGTLEPLRNPADHRDIVGHMRGASPDEIEASLAAAAGAASGWAAKSAKERAAILCRAADKLEARTGALVGLMAREAGKSFANAVAEVREAVDFLRYYSAEVTRTFGDGSPTPLGPIVCISPWNFPLAIFTGQVSAALAAGNTVLAKPASPTPLIAAEAVRVLHEAGVPEEVLRLVPGPGRVGTALVSDARVQGVMFTGSTGVARLIQKHLAERLTAHGQSIPFIAETGGQNALVVDSSALAEQVVGDVIASAFDSAGQRCSALRILCLQDDVADRILAMLKGAMRELAVGNPDDLSVDVGPVISASARDEILAHVETMRGRGHPIDALPAPPLAAHGTYVPPTIININRVADVEQEVFGPVLHVLRYRREDLDRLVDDINASGYGLTFGLHTRIDETIARVVDRIGAGNIYVNRNIIGAVVGVQPFGGHGLSGTGPKAGGPLYPQRLLAARASKPAVSGNGKRPAVVQDWLAHLRAIKSNAADACARLVKASPAGATLDLPGPVGERNVYTLIPRGSVLCIPRTERGLHLQISAALASGNRALIDTAALAQTGSHALDRLPAAMRPWITPVDNRGDAEIDAVLFEGNAETLRAINQEMAARPGAIVAVHGRTSDELAAGQDYALEWLLNERSISTNTTAAGGNASLMSVV
ncbi:MAG: trifunctional transcriptional regulator/proline dehydrogenase/L-glutamate gamma-semialdehyde dehydrogenase [Variibacter sp.]